MNNQRIGKRISMNMLSYRRISATLCGVLAVALGAAGPSHLAAEEGGATPANAPTEKKELRIPRVSKPWKDVLRLVGDGKTLCSDFALIQDKVGQWHCIGTFGKDGNGVGNGYAESDGHLMYYCADALKARTSDDLLHWSDPVTVLRDSTGSPHGYAESPQVIYRDGYYYLWTSGIDYSHAHLFISEDPFNFGDAVANSIEDTPGHAPEVVSDHGIDYLACSMVSSVPSATPAAHDLDGILIQPLHWDKPDPGMAERVWRSSQGTPVAAVTASALPQSAGAPSAPGGFGKPALPMRGLSGWRLAVGGWE